MHRPRDDFERDLYGDQAVVTWQIAPARMLLGMAVAVYLLAGSALVVVWQLLERASRL